jgi:hypothetical protein
MSGAIGGLLSSFSIRPTASLVMNLDATVGAMPGSNITTSASFDGSTQYLDIASTTAFGFGTADFTMEFWWRPTADVRSDLLDFNTTGTSVTRFDIGRVTSDTLDLYTDGTGGSNAKITGPTIASLLNAWHHIALTRQSGSIYMWVDGTQAGSTYNANVLDMGITGMSLRIMGDFNASGNGSGNLSNIRIVTGTALYTATFTPPTTTLRAVSGTQLLLPLAATVFTDMSSNMLAVTNNGTTVTSALAPTLAAATTDFTGTYAITTTNAGGSIAYNSANGGVFRKSTSSGTDSMVLGPNYVTGQSYTVFMAYKISATSPGRLLNTQSEAVKDWLLGAYNGNPNAFYPNFSVNLPASGADTVWHFAWGTFNTGTSLGQLYTATSAQPTSTSFTGTNAGGGGFNQLRLFSRAGGSEVQTADIGMIRVYNGVVTLAQVQSQYAAFKARFGY